MPSKTPKQARFMAAIAHNPTFARKVGVSQSIGREFNTADTGTKMLSGPKPPSVPKPRPKLPTFADGGAARLRALQVARRYANGGRAGYEDGGELPPQGEPYEETMQEPGWLNAKLPGAQDKSVRDFLGLMRNEITEDPSTAMGFTGVPSMLQGYDQFTDPEGGTLRKIAGASQMAMGALPAMRGVGPVGRALDGLTSTVPRTIATYGGLGLGSDAENTFPALHDLVAGRPAGATEAHASGLIPEAEAATLPGNPAGEDESRAWDTAQAAEASPARPELPPMPEAPKKYEGEPRKPSEVQTIQQNLINKGYLPPKKPDGRSSADGVDGGGTREAELQEKMESYDKALTRRQSIIDSMAKGTAAEAELKKTGEAEATRKAGEAKDKRYEEAKKDYDQNKSSWHTGTQLVAPFAGPVLGAVIGGSWGLRTAYKGREAAREAMDTVNKMIKGGPKYQADPKNFNDRVANVNRFWTGPNSGTDVAPFEHVPKPGPRGPFWRTTSTAPVEPASSLYPPQSRMPELKANAAMAGGVGAGEMGIGGLGLWMAYHDLDKAEAAAKSNPTHETLSDLEIAKDKVAIAKGVFGMGPTTAALKAGVGSLGILRRGAYQPNVNRADAERANLSEMLAQQKKKASGKRGAPSKPKAPKTPKGGETPPEGGGSGGGAGGMAPLLPLAATQLPQAASRSEEPAPSDIQTGSLPLPPEEEPRQDGGSVSEHHSSYQTRDRVGRFKGGPVYPKGSKSNAAKQGPEYRDTVNNALGVSRKYADGGATPEGVPPMVGGSAIARILARLLGKSRAVAPALTERPPVTQGTRDLYAMTPGLGKEGASVYSHGPLPKTADEAVRQQRFWDATIDAEPPTGSLHANGGQVGYDDGGPVPPQYGYEYRQPYGNPGLISQDSVREAQRINDAMPRSIGNPNALKFGAGVGTAMHFLARSKLPAPLRGLAGAAGLEIARRGGRDLWNDMGDAHDAIGEKIRLLDGKVKPGEEDRASGGEVGNYTGQYGGAPWLDLAALEPNREPRPAPPKPDDSYLPYQSYGEEPPVGEFFQQRQRRDMGGATPGFEDGGMPMPDMGGGQMAPNGDQLQVGSIIGHSDGRADDKPISVPTGSYVIPADVVSAMGSGNTLAGMKALKSTFGEARGSAEQRAVPIRISDGEFVMTPEQVAELGRGDIGQGHRILDAFVKYVRDNHIKTLQSLPGPAQDS